MRKDFLWLECDPGDNAVRSITVAKGLVYFVNLIDKLTVSIEREDFIFHGLLLCVKGYHTASLLTDVSSMKI